MSEPPLSTAAALPPEVLRSRRHTLALPRSRLGRLALRLQDRLEAFVAGVSVHPDTPVYDPALFPWVARLEAHWREIRAELDAVMSFRDRMPSFHEILQQVSTITTDDDWKTFFLMAMGTDCSGNARRCPRTRALLRTIPGISTAMFSILSPGKHIPPHRGAYNGVLRLHLALRVPEPRQRCRIRVADRVLPWEEGKAMIFDDSFNHEVWNDTGGYRVVLFVDFARPLRQPWAALNRGLLRLGPLAPFVREAGVRQKTWEQRFYGADAPR
ncbi:MAG: aspartyl/asparaginyl beta-hydroxylase domain-containing protein [Gammaproteobacteria bacterium]|nr:aspartyl/asparaginyl beta-hydroxylase domain-containing protein [Gammaproteobacteria bacterium]